jgi:hypothetical protein
MKLLSRVVALLFVFGPLATHTQAQDKTLKYEVGGQIFSFQGNEIGNGWGAGGRFGYNLNKYVSLDSELNGFLGDEGDVYSTEGMLGVKVGKRYKNFGVFAKVRPGFMTDLYLNNDLSRGRTRFLVDVGAVVEAYPSRHTIFRVDLGDAIIPFGQNTVAVANGFQRLGTTHNFQYSLGFGIRF